MQIHGFKQAILTPVEHNILEILPDFGVRLKPQRLFSSAGSCCRSNTSGPSASLLSKAASDDGTRGFENSREVVWFDPSLN
jgi:hypothetical protein